MSSTARMTFLYPHLFRWAERSGSGASSATVATTATTTWTCPRRVVSSASATGSGRQPRCYVRKRDAAPFGTTSSSRQSSFARRAGKAVEPLPFADEIIKPPLPPPPPSPEITAKVQGQEQQQRQQQHVQGSKETLEGPSDPIGQDTAAESAEEHEAQDSASGENEPQDQTQELHARADAKSAGRRAGPLELILHMDPPQGEGGQGGGQGTGGGRQHPHLSPPPYVHHFDSYSLVKQLEKGGYTEIQSITAMKAIRAILAQNLDVAQDSLVSKSDVENETYLFRAACSELGSEVKNNRRVADEELRQKRTLLQHEADILSQSLSQELATLNDNVRGMFNDRKIAVREEQKGVDSTIQQINYKISISLSSDAKSEIEGLRWVLIRRSVIGILFMAVFTLAMLRYGTYVRHEDKREAERIDKQAELLRVADGKKDHSSSPDAAEILAAN